ncbi:hypothetical protein [Methanothermobacter sp.]|uniref:hypothetical protein n=1 Tax=Methanothermobacter sp. TaxID=1884223 RepID=UPI00262EA1E9|nr:hypothetical protein [Methanothermobacter sp.]MDI9617832.1 hypothetical protein [Methanothermobacter sp.]
MRWKGLDGMIPGPAILMVAMLLYISGFLLDASGMPPPYGFLNGNMVVHFSSFPGFREQFIDYLGATAFWIFISNITQVLVFIFTLATTIQVLKVIILSGALLHNLISMWGFRGFLIYAGTVHLHLEVMGCLFSLQAARVFIGSVLESISRGSAEPMMSAIKERLLFLIVLVAIIFAMAAIIEVFWSTWWVYIFTERRVSWTYFHSHVAAVEL